MQAIINENFEEAILQQVIEWTAKEYMKANSLNQEGLADLLGMTPPTLSKRLSRGELRIIERKDGTLTPYTKRG